MHRNITRYDSKKKLQKLIFIGSILFLILLFDTNIFNIFNQNADKYDKIDEFGQYDQSLLSANGESILFEGSEASLNITDFGNLYEYNQEISVSNQEELNLSYYLDETNNWKVNRIEISINNLQDTRNWVNNSGFQPVQIFRKYQNFESPHDYLSNQDAYNDIEYTITESGAYYMRVHFVNMLFDYQNDATDSDFMLIMNGSLSEVFAASGSRTDFYSPWSIGETMYLSYESNNDPGTLDYGYYIDYYEIINASSNFEVNSVNWKGRSVQSGSYGSNTFGFGNISGNDAMFIGYHGSWYSGSDLETFGFWEGTFTEAYQEDIIIPRGKVIDAYLSFDYYGQFALETNNIILYMNINGKKVYSKGLLDLSAEGKNLWHHTGKVPMYLWINQTNVFTSGNVIDQTLNVSIGLRNAGSSTAYSGYDDGNANLVWLDNIILSITTVANATQDGINLTIDNFSFEPQNEWGKATLNLTEGWDTNPITLTINTTSPELTYDLNTIIYGYHETLSSYNQLYDKGVSYKILENGTIFWELYHYLYMPLLYQDFEFTIEKPKNWQFISVLDPFLQNREFENGNIGDNYIHINKSNALFAGWYTLTATSPNYLDITNIKLFKQGQWVQNANFSTGESTQISAQLDYMGDIPADIGYINLTVYYPNRTLFYEESQAPIKGNVTFSEIEFGAFNTTGGIYDFKLIWSNGTALGGLKSSFVVNHQSSITLLKPDDAISDLTTEAFVGDLIPLRIQLKDSENNKFIPNAIITYNWSIGGTPCVNTLTEAALGVYEAVLYTSDLVSNGFYEIFINSSKIGFKSYNITLKINLLEETNLLRLDSEYYVELHDNSTVKYSYTNSLGEGILGAKIYVNINSEYYSIIDHLDGNYTIKFDTSYINDLGIYQIKLNFSALAFEIQNAIFQFEIIEQSVGISVYINAQKVQENSLIEAVFKEDVNISIRIFGNVDNFYLTGGNVTWNSNYYYKNIIEGGNAWFNDTIPISNTNFSTGLNFVYVRFEQENYQITNFGFQLLISEQNVDLSVYINSQKIQENSLIEVMFKEDIDVSVRIFAQTDNKYLTGGNITWNSNYYYKNIIEGGNAWFNETIPISIANFSAGLNFVYVRFEQENYQIKNFGFQLLISEQTVNISTFINDKEIIEYSIKELTFKEKINISARVYAHGEKIYLSGANITFISDYYNKDLQETTFPWYNTSLEISDSYFNPGINYVYIKFQLENYTTDIFSFQFLIKAQKINLTVLINSEKITENYLLEFDFNDIFSISAQSLATSEMVYLADGLMTFVTDDYEKNCTGYANYWYNTSISCSLSIFSLGVNYVYLRFQKENYSTTIFSFQILINQIEIRLNPISFEDSIETEIGETINIQIQLLDPKTNVSIEHAYISYSWEYGIGTLNETTPGLYQVFIDLPENLQGNFKFNLIITPENSIYKTLQYSFIVVIREPILDGSEFPNYLLWIIIGVLLIVASALGALSLRSYVFLPRKRRKEAELLSKTQKFKDLKNIQAIVVVHKLSGIPIYSKSYSILEKHKKELFSGFIQAITTIGEEFIDKEIKELESTELEKGYGIEKMIELDFKQFYCLIADIEEIRTVFILKERSSERLKSQISHLILALNLKLSNKLEDWDGSLDDFQISVPEILNEYFELYYKDSFVLSDEINLITMKKEKKLTKMEMRVINVIQSMSEDKKIADLNNIVELVSEENKDLIIEAIESLLKQKLIIPLSN